MSNYNYAIRTNYFRVTDEERYKKIFSQLFCVDGEEIFDFTKEEGGQIYHSFGTYGFPGYNIENCKEKYPELCDDCDCQCFDDFLSDLQQILPEDEVFIYTDVGHEKLLYLNAYSFIVTKNDISLIDLEGSVIAKVREMLGKEDSSTEISF